MLHAREAHAHHSDEAVLPQAALAVQVAEGIVMGVFVLLLAVFIAGLFVWAAKKDGEEDVALQKRLGIRRRTRLGR